MPCRAVWAGGRPRAKVITWRTIYGSNDAALAWFQETWVLQLGTNPCDKDRLPSEIEDVAEAVMDVFDD